MPPWLRPAIWDGSPPRTKIVWRPRAAPICSPSLMALKISESWLKKQAAPAFGATTFWDSDISGFGLRFFAPTRRHAPGARSFSVNYRVRRREKRFTVAAICKGRASDRYGRARDAWPLSSRRPVAANLSGSVVEIVRFGDGLAIRQGQKAEKACAVTRL